MAKPLNRLAGASLDRAADRRTDAAWLDERLRDATSRVVPVWKSQSLVSGEATPRAICLPIDHPDFVFDDGRDPIFLGLEGDAAVFALGLPSPPDGPPPLREEGDFRDLHRVGGLLGHADGALLAYARAMVLWHERHRFCGRCGHATESAEGGHLRRCQDETCGEEHYPRTDPAVIVLVTDGDRCLLGRKKGWPPAIHSTIAGFVEPGESLREAVEREVFEETGIRVGAVEFHSSQPWPFPSSLMLGFTATRVGGKLRVDHKELEDARWFRKAEIGALIDAGDLRLPSRVSISRRLIEDWLAEAP